MVITKLIGGLGNQMFQYAAGRALAVRNGSELLLDLSGFANYTLRPYALDEFRITARPATPAHIEWIRRGERWSPVTRMSRRFPALKALARHHLVTERYFHFDPAVTRLRGNIHLDGYWQSEKYFRDVADVIRMELRPRSEPDTRNRELATRIRGASSVSIHVRRGDYVSNAEANAVHGTCSPEYYEKAVAFVAHQVPNPELFVFSDDAAWARENLRFTHPTTHVTHNGADRPHEDMRLMSSCRHHVIANSSFSWWGAWLGDNPDKRVVAPREWFRRRELDTRDLIPDSWTLL